MPNNTILFVDDSATMRAIMEKTFTGEDFELVTVASGETALAKAKEISPALIIADAGMAGVTGYDVCQRVREDADLAATPVIIMAGVSHPYDETRGNQVGASEYVKKPFDTTQLIEKVSTLVEAAPAAEAPAPAPAAAEPEPAPSAAEETPKKTLDFAKPAPPKPPVPPVRPKPEAPPAPASAPEPDPEPIELTEPAEGEDGAIKVSTLAELAQMNESGQRIEQDTAEEAIELPDAPDAPEPEPEPEPAAPAPAAREAAVDQRAQQAAAEVATRVSGLTAEQVEAVQALTAEVLERVVWEVVPDLAEAMIREEINKILAE